MGKASSAKKVAKAARAGGHRGGGVRERNLLFPGIVGLVVLLGVALIAFSRSDYQDGASNVAPISFQDHWHAAFGVFVCGEGEGEDDQGFINVTDQFDSSRGIHSHGDSLLHIHPTSRTAAGENARLDVYVEESPLIELSDDEITVGDESWKEGEDTCNGEEAEVVVAQWEDVLAGGDPAIFNNGFGDVRFRQDGEGYVVAFVPKGEYDDIPVPQAAAELGQVSGGISAEDMLNDPSQMPDFDPEDLPEGVSPEDLLQGGGAGEGSGEGSDAPADAEGSDADAPDADAEGSTDDGG